MVVNRSHDEGEGSGEEHTVVGEECAMAGVGGEEHAEADGLILGGGLGTRRKEAAKPVRASQNDMEEG